MRSTRIWMLRHGETVAPHLFHGLESDVGLSDRGMQRARNVAERLAVEKPDAVICSGMVLAISTAKPIADACGLGLRIETSLHERRIGFLSGTAIDAADGPWPETLRRWIAGDTSYAPTGAESFDDLRARLLPIWDHLLEEYSGGFLVIVTHGIVCKVLLLSLLPGWSVADWQRLGPMRHAAVHELIHEGVCRAIAVNDQPVESVGQTVH